MAKGIMTLLLVAVVIIVLLTGILYFLPCGTTIEKFVSPAPALTTGGFANMSDNDDNFEDYDKENFENDNESFINKSNDDNDDNDNFEDYNKENFENKGEGFADESF